MAHPSTNFLTFSPGNNFSADDREMQKAGSSNLLFLPKKKLFKYIITGLLFILLMPYNSLAKTNPIISWAIPSPITYGIALSGTQLNATANVPGTFSYSPAAGTVLNAGTQNLTVNFTPTNKSLYNSVSKTVQLIVNKANATVTITASTLSQTYNGSPKPVTVTTSPAGVATTVTYSGIAPTIYNSSTTAPTNVGSYSVVAKITSTNYTGPDANGTLTINPGAAKIDPVITWANPSSITYGTAIGKKQLNATANVSGNFVYNPVSGTRLNAGTQILSTTFTPTNTAQYNTVSKTVTLIVNKASATVTLSNLSQTYNGSTKSATVVTNPSGLTNLVTYNGSATAPVNAGSYSVVATITDPNYNGSATGTLVINKATATLSLSNLNQNYDGSPKPATVTTSPAGLSVVSVTYGGSATAPSAVGSYAVVASLTNANYTASNATGTLLIASSPATITFGNLSQVFDGSPKSATVTTNPAGLSYAITYNGSVTAPTNAGSYSIVATITNSNYSGSANGTLVIGKATATLSLSNLSQSYDGSSKSVTATTNPVGLSGVAVTYDGSATAPSAAGSYEVIASLNNANYIATNATGTLVIAAGIATISLSDLTQTYDDSPKSATVSTSPSGLTYSITYDGSATVPTNAGSYSVTATITDANYSGSTNGTLVIGKATATLSLSNLSQSYDGSAKSVAVIANPAGLSGVSITYDASAAAPSAVGSYAVVASLNNANYTASDATGTLVIASSSATITLSNLSHVYDGTQKSATVTTNPTGLSYAITYNGSITLPVNAGSYNVEVTITESNYGGSTTGSLIIDKATATLSLSNLNQNYDGSSKPITVTTNPAGLNGVSVTYDGSATAPSDIGSYSVVASLNNANYAASDAPGTLVVASGQATISLSNLSQTYDGSSKSATAITNPAGLSYSITYNGSATAPTNAGSYDVAATITEANYNGTANGTLVISKATTTLSLSNLNQNYDGSPKSVTVTTNPAGLSGVSVTYDGSATAPSVIGSYAVVASLNNANYTASNAAGTLVIASGQATITLSNLNHTYDGSPKSATATTNPAGLSYNITYNGSATAPTNGGSYDVVATITDANYSGSANGTLVISKATATLSLSNLSQNYDGSPKAATVTTNPTGLSGVSITYNGSASVPANAGSYAIVATLNNTNYNGTISGTLVINKATPVITWSAPANIKYGIALSNNQLNASANVAGGFIYSPAAGTVLSAQNEAPQTLTVNFTPADATNYLTANGTTVSLTVLKDSLYIRANDKTKTYGTGNPAFNASYLGGKVKIVVLGSSTAAGTGASAGKQWTTLLNTRLINEYGTTTVSISNLATGVNTTYSILPTGTNNGSRPAVDPTRNITAALALNPQIILINMPSNDVANGYTSTETINNFATVINAARAAGVKVILTGTQPRSNIDLALRQLLQSENQSLLSIYGSDCVNIYDELTDLSDYTIKALYSNGDGIHVNDTAHAYIYSKIFPPVKAWIEANTTGFVNGDSPASLSGTLNLFCPAVTNSAVGTYAIFSSNSTLSSTNYKIFYKSGVLTVTKATSVVTWNTPASITYGTPLSSQQLNATSPVGGSFVYTPAAGTVLNAGTQNLSVTFTPTDQANYQPSATSVSLTVNKAPLLVRANDTMRSQGTTNPTFTASYLGGTIKIVVLGSSTAVGTGASPASNSWLNLLTNKLTTDFPGITTAVTNLAVGGYTTYHILPTGTNNGSRPAVDAAHNITAALALSPQLILINMPSNDVASNFTSTETINNFATVINAAHAAGVKVIITGTQPRSDIGVAARPLLQSENQSLLSIYGSDCVNIYDELTDIPNNYVIKAVYSFGDGIHINNAGHSYIYSQMLSPVEAWVRANTTGFVNGDNINSLSGSLNLTCPATESSPVGTYSIIASGNLSSPNYTVSYANGVLTVTGAANRSIASAVQKSEVSETKVLSLSAWPNPFSDRTIIRFGIKNNAQAIVGLYDLHGALIRQVYKGNVAAGSEINAEISANGLAAGVYLLRLNAGSSVAYKRLVVIR